MNPALASFRLPAPLERWFAARTRRERAVIGVLAALLVLILLWAAVWQPVQRDLGLLSVSVPAEARALASARAMSDEMAALARGAPRQRAADSRAELDRIANERGVRGAMTQLDWQDDRARVVFAAISVDALVPFLEAVERDAQLRIVEATLAARVEPGTVRAELTLAR